MIKQKIDESREHLQHTEILWNNHVRRVLKALSRIGITQGDPIECLKVMEQIQFEPHLKQGPCWRNPKPALLKNIIRVDSKRWELLKSIEGGDKQACQKFARVLARVLVSGSRR